MDVLISLVLEIGVLLVLAVLVLGSLGVGDQFLRPAIGFFGMPVIWLSSRINDGRRKRAIKKLPPDIPPPPQAP